MNEEQDKHSKSKEIAPDICNSKPLSRIKDSINSQKKQFLPDCHSTKDIKINYSENKYSQDNLEDLQNIIRNNYLEKCHKGFKKLLNWIISIEKDCFESTNGESYFINLYQFIIEDMRSQLLDKQSVTLEFPNDDLDNCLRSFCKTEKINDFFINWIIQRPCGDSSINNFKGSFLDRIYIYNIFPDKPVFKNYSEEELQEQVKVFKESLPSLFQNGQNFKLEDVRKFLKSVIYIYKNAVQYSEEALFVDLYREFFDNYEHNNGNFVSFEDIDDDDVQNKYSISFIIYFIKQNEVVDLDYDPSCSFDDFQEI